MAVNYISPDKVVGSFFDRASRNADISGNVPSDHLVTKEGRKGRRTTDKVKIHDDMQFKGRAFRGNGSTIQAESVSITPGLVSEVRMKVVFKLNQITNQTICSWNGNSTQYVILNLDGSDFFEVTRRNSATQYDTLTTTKGVLNHWYEVDLIITPTSFSISIDGVVETQTALPVATPSPNGAFILCGFRTANGANSNASIASFQGWLDGVEKCNYLIEESSGSVLYDYSPNANHADIINTIDNTHFHEDSGIPYSHLNEKGYNEHKGTFVNANKFWRADKTTDWNWSELCGLTDATDGLTDNFLMEFKVKWPEELSNSGDRYLFRDESGYYPIRFFKYAENGVGDKLRFFFMGKDTTGGNTDLESVIINGDIEDGYWHHILIHVYRDSVEPGALREDIYFDGVLDTSNLHETILGLRYDNSTATFDIGESWDGHLSDLKFYDATRLYTTEQVQDHLAGKPVVRNYCKAHFAFDRVTDTVVDRVQGLNLKLHTGSVTDSDILTEYYGASLIDPGKDVLGNALQYKGTLAPRIQLANAPCVVLNGTDQSINLPYETPVAGDRDTTFWFKVKIDPGSGDYTVFGSGDLSLFRWSTSETTIRLRGHTNGAESIMTFPHSIRTGEWQDIVLIRRVSDSKFTCYINGVQNTEGYISVSSGNSFRINSLGEGSTRWTDGEISLFGKWFRSFSLAEIQALSTQLPSTDRIEDLYVFSEGSGSTVYDISGNNNHATIVNAILPDVWGKQNVFHYNFYKGFIKSLKDMDGVEAFFDFTDINAYTFNESGQITSVRDTANDYQLINTHPDTRFENGALTLTGNRLSIEGDHFLSTLNSFDIFIRGEFKLPYSSQTDFLVVSNNTNTETWTIGKHPIPTIPNVYYDAASATPAYSGSVEVTQVILDQELGYNIKYDGTNLYTGRDTNGLTDHGATSKPADNPLLTRIDFGIDGSQKYLIVFNRNVTDHERSFVNAFMESGLAPAGAVNGVVDQRGYEETNQFNGASDVLFPDIPYVPVDLRGSTFSEKEVDGLAYAGRVLNERNGLTLFQEKVESIHLKRKGARLILDDYRSTCPGTALQKIHSDFTGTIITVRNEDNLQDASFGFDAYGRLPEKDIIDHLNGTANGRVRDYYFQDVGYSGLGYTQTTLSEMPFIAKNGVIQKDSRGLPALRFDGTQSMSFESQTAFKAMHDGSIGVQVIGFQVDEGQDDFWVIGNSDFASMVGFEFYGDVFNSDKLHFIVRTNTSNSAVQDLDIPLSMGSYNRVINYIDPANPIASERHLISVNEMERAANTFTELPNTGNTEDGTTSIGGFGSREMEGYINELVFIGDYKADIQKLSRSLMYMP